MAEFFTGWMRYAVPIIYWRVWKSYYYFRCLLNQQCLQSKWPITNGLS